MEKSHAFLSESGELLTACFYLRSGKKNIVYFVKKRFVAHLSDQSLFLANGWGQKALIISLVFWLLLVGCNDMDSPEPQLESISSINAESSTVATPQTPIPIATTHASPLPTLTPTLISDTTLPSTHPLNLLIAGFQITDKGKDNETYELWLINSRTQEKQLVFTTPPGKQTSTMIWGGIQSDFLYVLEVKDTEVGYNAWQLYEINYKTGTSNPFFDENESGFPRLLDISAQGKWIRLLVEDLSSAEIGEIWFINTEDGTIVKSEQFFFGFTWSPDDPDKFAYSQNVSDTRDEKTPQSIIIRKVPELEIQDIIDYQYTNWGSDPSLVWHPVNHDQIFVFVFDEAYLVDLTQRSWSLITQDFLFLPDNTLRQTINISPSGKWLLLEYSGYIDIVQLSNLEVDAIHLKDEINQRHLFLSWYNNDTATIVTEAGDVGAYELGENLMLLGEVNLEDYGLVIPEWYTTIAKPIQ